MTDRRDFAQRFGRAPEVEESAPGRVNLIGEHTDYNDGYVLPVAIPQRTTACLAARSDKTVRVWSANVPDEGQPAAYELGQEQRCGSWVDYVQGVTAVLAQSGFSFTGFNLGVDSTVPLGAGLASSATLEVAVTRALARQFDLPLDDLAVARTAHAAETGFVGVPVGLMDQMAASHAREGEALFIDIRSLDIERIALPVDVELLVIDSGIVHEHASSEYRVRRRECVEASGMLGASVLRDVTLERLAQATLAAPLDRRARHVVTENHRVVEMARALRDGDVRLAGTLMNRSHASMRDDFEVSTPEIDTLVEVAHEGAGVMGARLTGGGFGGCVVALVRRGEARATGTTIAEQYAVRTGRHARVLVP